MILSIRSDSDTSQIALHDDGKLANEIEWQAGRTLSKTLLQKIEELCKQAKINPVELDGLVVFKGPGSFTGLRIGISAANALAYSYKIPIVSAAGSSWLSQGIERLKKGENEEISLPEYGGEANITKPRK